MTTESNNNGIITLSRMNLSGYWGHVTTLVEGLLLHAV